jgi:hypothetical protein
VEYSVQAAQKTKYEPSTFGGILQYTAAALASYDEERERRAGQEAITQCKLCNSAGFINFREPNGRIFATRCPHDPEKIRAREKREGLTRI